MRLFQCQKVPKSIGFIITEELFDFFSCISCICDTRNIKQMKK